MQIYVNRAGQQYGPFTADQLQACLQQGTITAVDWAWHEGLASWVQISDLDLSAPQPQPLMPVAEIVPQAADTAPRAEAAQSAPAKKKKAAKKTPKQKKKIGDKLNITKQQKQIAFAAIAIPLSAILIYYGYQGWVGDKIIKNDEGPDRPDLIKKLDSIGSHYEMDINSNINSIAIPSIPISAKGWAILVEFKNINSLTLVDCKLKDADLVTLLQFSELQTLDLSNNMITDAAVEQLKTIKKLRLLNLKNTEVTPAGVAALKEALPECHVESGASAPAAPNNATKSGL